MARIRGHRNLNEDKPLYVMRRSLVADGRTFEIGDEFPWRELAGITPRKIRQLHDQHKISHDPPERPMVGAEDPGRSPGEQERADERASGRARQNARPARAVARGLG